MKRKGIRQKKVEAYTDEAGHTGLNLFDPAQPWFWTGTLLSRFPLQATGAELMREISASVGQPLHAKELGIQKIETIAKPLKRFLERVDAHFVLTVVEKRHVASGKLADTVLDSTMNAGVSPLHYSVHGLRLLLASVLVDLTVPADQEQFWAAYRDGEPKGLGQVLNRLALRMTGVPGMDRKLRSILSDALIWGARHPQELLDFRQTDLDAPNMVAFHLLMDGIHDVLDGSGFKVGRFVHDEQQQFGRFMKEAYAVARRLKVPTHATARITEFHDIGTYECEIEILPSRDVVGLQAIDLALWLYRRSISVGLKNAPDCSALVQFVHDRAEIRQHSRAQLKGDAERCFRDVMREAVNPEQIERGRKVAEDFERAKISRMWSRSPSQ